VTVSGRFRTSKLNRNKGPPLLLDITLVHRIFHLELFIYYVDAIHPWLSEFHDPELFFLGTIYISILQNYFLGHKILVRALLSL